MPVYEYRCTKGHTFDVTQSVNDEPVRKCQVCGSPVQRVLHAPAVHFKGSGFYNTDYGTRKRQREKSSAESSSSESNSSSSEKTTTSDASSSSSSSPDSKPAAKPKAKSAE